MLRSAVEQATSAERLSEFAKELEQFLVKAQLGLVEENPAKALTSLVKDKVLDPALEALKATNAKPCQALYEAFADTVHYGTGCAQAAEEAGVDPTDLAWLLSKQPDIKKDAISVSGKLKKRRTPKKRKA